MIEYIAGTCGEGWALLLRAAPGLSAAPSLALVRLMSVMSAPVTAQAPGMSVPQLQMETRATFGADDTCFGEYSHKFPHTICRLFYVRQVFFRNVLNS